MKRVDQADELAGYAAEAKEMGRAVFAAQLTAANYPGRPVDELAEVIEAVEAHGWKFDQFTSVWHNGNMTYTCLFRRAKQESKRYRPSWTEDR